MNIPKVFQNKKLNIEGNQQDLFYGNSRVISPSNTSKNIDSTLKKLFASSRYIYKLNVTVVLKDKRLDTTIIGKTNNHIITYDNNLIPIKDIIDIYER